jgi:hypothetical protein
VAETGDAPGTVRYASSRWVVITYATLGVACVALALLLPFVLSDPRVGLLLMSLPLGVLGVWLLRTVPRLARARITLDETGLTLEIPTWAGGRLRQGRGPVHLRWDEVTGLVHRRVTRPGAYSLVVDEYIIVGRGEEHVLTKNIVPRPEALLQRIGERTGLAVEDRA